MTLTVLYALCLPGFFIAQVGGVNPISGIWLIHITSHETTYHIRTYWYTIIIRRNRVTRTKIKQKTPRINEKSDRVQDPGKAPKRVCYPLLLCVVPCKMWLLVPLFSRLNYRMCLRVRGRYYYYSCTRQVLLLQLVVGTHALCAGWFGIINLACVWAIPALIFRVNRSITRILPFVRRAVLLG